MSTSSPSPIPFLILGLVTGGALLYVSYWVWPPSQRRNSTNSNTSNLRTRTSRGPNRRNTASTSTTATTTATRNTNRRSNNNGGSNSSATGLRRSNATRRSRQPLATRREDSRHRRSDDSSSDEGETSGYTTASRLGAGADSDEEDVTDHEYGTMDEDGYEKLPLEDSAGKHDGLQLMNLLYAIAEDQASKGGITCNSCRTVPIRGLRYKCANCQDYDLCEGCEAAEVHIKSHVFMKIRIPIPPLANSRTKKLPPFYPGTPSGSTSTPEHLLHELLQKTHFDNVELDAMYMQYLSLSTLTQEGGGITRLTFEQALGPLGLEKNLITGRIFHFFDQDDDGIINFKEMACGLSVLCKGNFDEKIDFAFQGYDLDGDGYISKEELYEMFKAYFYLSMELIRDVVKTMENDLMNNFEYQPGMPISSTFTAPIPREVGVRSNRSEERRRTRERAPLPAEWSLSIIPNESGNSTSGTQPSSTSSVESPQSPSATPIPDVSDTQTPTPPLDDQEPEEGHVRALPSTGGYGLVGEDAYAEDDDDDEEEGEAEDEKDEDESDKAPDASSDSEHTEMPNLESVTNDNMPRSELVGGSDSEYLLSSNEHETASHGSEAEDSGVDSNGWQPVATHRTTPNHTQESSSHNPTEATPPSTGSSATDSPIQEHSESSTSGHRQSNSTEPVAPSTQSTSDAGSNNSNNVTNSNRSLNRPRKDQPLPLTTTSSHSTNMSTSNPHLTWDHQSSRSRTNMTSSATSDMPVSPHGPSLVPAFAIGFGLQGGPNTTIEETRRREAATADQAMSSGSSRNNVHPRRPSLGPRYPSYASTSSVTPSGSYANASYFSSTFPVMESISQGAIQEMVDRTFGAIKSPSRAGYITIEEFRAYVLTDAGILGWFDALGSIF
ncbi:hypothetical protein BGZ94_009547 [Podila epigama]|nr:hypothetical protein BGZ94_009547 [Podila epigama]